MDEDVQGVPGTSRVGPHLHVAQVLRAELDLADEPERGTGRRVPGADRRARAGNPKRPGPELRGHRARTVRALLRGAGDERRVVDAALPGACVPLPGGDVTV